MNHEELKANHEPQEARALARHYLRDMIYGANDGIITTFAIVSGVAGASRALVTNEKWIPAGLEMLVVGATSAAVAYGVGAWIAGITQ